MFASGGEAGSIFGGVKPMGENPMATGGGKEYIKGEI
jgi:hypothetical protein